MCREMLQLTHCWHHDDDGKKGTFQVIDDVGFFKHHQSLVIVPFYSHITNKLLLHCSQPVNLHQSPYGSGRSHFTVDFYHGFMGVWDV